jgi:hypothetical protein
MQDLLNVILLEFVYLKSTLCSYIIDFHLSYTYLDFSSELLHPICRIPIDLFGIFVPSMPTAEILRIASRMIALLLSYILKGMILQSCLV